MAEFVGGEWRRMDQPKRFNPNDSRDGISTTEVTEATERPSGFTVTCVTSVVEMPSRESDS
jgi:hypothetical protein